MTTRDGIIAALNDRYRAALIGPGGRTVLTRGIAALPEATVADILLRVARFRAFTPDNDPWGEHDGAIVTLPDGTRILWKIDYFADERCEAGAEDPATGCFRVLTIMLAEEY